MPYLSQKFSTEQAYLFELGRIATYWVKPRPGSYDDLKDSRLMPRGL